MPSRNVPAQNHAKFASNSANAAIAAPLAPSAAPIQNPGRRPIRAISSAAGIVAVIMPVICTAIDFVFIKKAWQMCEALRRVEILGWMTLEVTVEHQKPEKAARCAHGARD